MTNVLEVRDLVTRFYTMDGIVHAVNGVSFDLHEGETLAIVGESGSGKSVTMMSLLGLIPMPPGKIEQGQALFRGGRGERDLLQLSPEELRQVRGGQIGFVFQDPISSLNPILTIGEQISESLTKHLGMNRDQARERTLRLLHQVGIPDPELRFNAYPFQFSGGMRQRVMIAMSLSCNPEILIADEPTSALDVTIQAQILEIMQELTKRLGTAVILITHSLGVVAGTCDTLCVMYAGRIVERGPTDVIFEDPKHPYTKGLIRSVPRLDVENSERLYSIQGQPPNVIDLPDCCPFYPRCEKAMDICKKKYPAIANFEQGRAVSCWLYSGAKDE